MGPIKTLYLLAGLLTSFNSKLLIYHLSLIAPLVRDVGQDSFSSSLLEETERSAFALTNLKALRRIQMITRH